MSIMGSMSDEKEQRPSGVAGIIWLLEHAQDLVSLIVGVLLLVAGMLIRWRRSRG